METNLYAFAQAAYKIQVALGQLSRELRLTDEELESWTEQDVLSAFTEAEETAWYCMPPALRPAILKAAIEMELVSRADAAHERYLENYYCC